MSDPSQSQPIQGKLFTKNYIEFSIVSNGLEILQFQGAQKARGCLPGDEVQWDTEHQCLQLVSVSNHQPIVGILQLTSKTRYGLTSRGHPIFLFRPFDASYPPFIVASSQKNLEKNMLCSIHYKDNWKPDVTTFPKGEIIDYFGQVGDWQAERSALLMRWCPWKPGAVDKTFWENCQRNSKQLQERFEISDAIGYTFHIDPEGCKDVDDIITICPKKEKEDYFAAIITISDVGAWIESNSRIAQTASQISQTFYSEKGVVLRSMLANILSEGVLSLKNQRNDSDSWKLGISLRIYIGIDSENKPHIITNSSTLSPALLLSKIKSSSINTFTYDNFTVNRLPNREFMKYSEEIYEAIENYLNRPGFDWNTHNFIETCMLFYNEWVGTTLANHRLGVKTIYRSQDSPCAERVNRWKELGRIHGFGDELAWLGASAAKYTLGTGGHAGLNLQFYTHSSSPIRRFSDLWNQWLLHEVLENSGQRDLAIDNLIERVNERSKAAKRFSRELAILATIESGRREFEGVCLEWREGSSGFWKGRFWIAEWKEIAIVRQMADKMRPEPGSSCRIRCGVNLASGVWRERFVLEIVACAAGTATGTATGTAASS